MNQLFIAHKVNKSAWEIEFKTMTI